MKRVIFFIGLLLSMYAYADDQWTPTPSDKSDEISASLHGTCTRKSCPPGTFVVVDARKGDSGMAVAEDGKSYDLLELRNIKFTVLQNDNDYKSDSRVVAPGGAIYTIQWIFLKKV
ncbi:TPA: hypothetical protein PXM11_003619 [Yersinia enterocolitica]|uniref:hypothetical protein n=1 Tax=Yersinia enterocolitica TaxID=630 RepID=UPI00067A8B51|nr:hypothetical protein [Yersinia enterocolitica]AOF18427.1 hypothetical protein BED34_07175 [Yersinia enterocolitica]AOF22959.1 hypothetical protein BED33_09835 [Yersinia enterocolitica]AOF26669.1 hypothetical protein BED32_07150 [Yersinia enterocolitica]AOF30781.1 hypothetical protein BED35_07625 [Yersinia enterocolitica]AOF34701.1 hypothetical protein BFS78_06695 [Yersinia enterocolitica]